MDDELSPRARDLVEFAMAHDLPDDGVAVDSWGMVVSRISADTERDDEAAGHDVASATRARRRPLAVIGVAALAACVAVWWFARRAEPTPPEPVAARAKSAPRPQTAATARSDATGASTSALLVQAEAARDHDPLRALELLDRHAALAPSEDADQRIALRVEVLCVLGRTEHAQAEAAAFLARPRAAPWSARVRASCAAVGDP
ncbi:MAG: hypothetical protein K1X88_35025 [Nannocystaceae bacterium]|nr:hypothetical protein [Nannocystaceae bacterium]